MKLLFGINHCFVVSLVVTLFSRYHVEHGFGDVLESLWISECFKTYELWGFFRQLNHLSIDVIHIGIPVLNICKFCRSIQRKELLLMCLVGCNEHFNCKLIYNNFKISDLNTDVIQPIFQLAPVI